VSCCCNDLGFGRRAKLSSPLRVMLAIALRLWRFLPLRVWGTSLFFICALGKFLVDKSLFLADEWSDKRMALHLSNRGETINPPMDLRPVTKTTLSSEVAEQLISIIRAGDLKPGDKLPSERLLSERLKVGRSSIREAMKTLEAMDFVNRTTLGTVVCEVPIQKIGILKNHTEIHEVIETRKVIEIELAGLAALRAGSKDIEKIEKTIEMEDATLWEDVETYTARDTAFHKALAEAAHNSVLSQVYQMIAVLLFKTHKYHSLINPSGTGIEEERTRRTKTLSEHRAILRAIRNHAPAEARKAMKKHLTRVERALIDRVRTGVDGKEIIRKEKRNA
jgi:GntR family transcriptional regulator, transcriptional repressor for pyruvate dehydrogenase complex